MADSATDFSAATGILKDMLGGFKSSLRDSLPPLYAKLKPSTKKVGGKGFKFSVQTEEPQGVGSIANSSAYLPAAVPGEYIECAVPYTRMYGTLLFDDMMLAAAGQGKEGEKAFVNFLRQEMKGIKNFMGKEIGRQIWGAANGFICACGTTNASLTVTLATTALMRHFAKGQHIDLVLYSNGVAIANGSDRVIQSVNVSAKTIVLDTAGGVVTTDSTTRVTRKGAYNAEMTGLGSIMSTDNIYGITTASYRRWQPYLVTSAGAFDVQKVITAAIDGEAEMGGDPTIIVSNPDLQAQYWFQLTGSRTFDQGRAPTPAKVLGAGFYELQVVINGKPVPWISDPNCPSGEMHMLNLDDISLGHISEPDWFTVKGEILLPNVLGSTGTPTYKAVIKYYPQMICEKRNSHIKITGFTDISGWRA